MNGGQLPLSKLEMLVPAGSSGIHNDSTWNGGDEKKKR